MTERPLPAIKKLLEQCTVDERKALFKELRAAHQIHQLEYDFGAPAEIILEAIHRAPELTRRMLRGVIADAAFAQYVVPALAERGWKDDTPAGNHSFDHMLRDSVGLVSVQVKLQRSEAGSPVVTTGTRYGLLGKTYMVEVQRTRSGTAKIKKVKGKKSKANKTRPYTYGEFDVLAVSLWPSNGQWHSFRYTVGKWLLAGAGPNQIATYQPVAMEPNDDWADSFDTAAQWFRSNVNKKIRNKK